MATRSDDADCASIWGDFVDSDDECEVEDASEPPERYDKGLYYPIFIGEILINRYRIEHKLGHGGFSTVWMAHDMVRDVDVALKIMTPGTSAEREYAAQNMIASEVQDTTRLLIYRDTFLLPATNTEHRVLVFPLLGPSLRTHAASMSVAARMSSAKQLLQAIKALHDAGVVHRDINCSNALYGLAPFESGTELATKYKHLGRPQKMHIPTCKPTWKEGELVMPISPHESLVQTTITLADFGLAVKSGTSLERDGEPPPIYCAPERFHGVEPGFESDMWGYMCIFANLCIGFNLFRGSIPRSALDFMVKSLGPLPSTWRDFYDGGGQYDESWYDQDSGPDSHQTLEAKIKRSRYGISPVGRQLVLSILQRGLAYNPEDRFSAGQLLEDAVFKELMALHGL
ncbi:kinase domain-containing protein [Fusarium flagelliforme]|uniref:Cmgc protein kinase n=1 Tax=Fusarium flagelliforme TaxID=2675880 RepID=A0A395MS52_9HYPO|nr:kinase domain-containing protein [Fusarium flagelliforme]KAH7173253.1 kinase domain-containing protein [Fusarium flagelliforme]RFN50794.1 cmgc protein kinase [Fusarium flagelliforme]